MITCRIFVLFALCFPDLAGADLEALRSTLVAMRGQSARPIQIRGATPQLTVAKHLLRDWVESRLKELARDGDEGDLGKSLNAELREAKLSCAANATCPDWFQTGFLEDIKFRRSRGVLILQTGVGIECGFDESAYLYSWTDEGWRRVWQNEQNIYTKEAYKPQTIHSVLISPYSKANDYVVLTLGTEPWCMSNWHDVYYRAFRLGPDPEAPPLVEGSDWAYVDRDPPIHGSLTGDEVLVEYEINRLGGYGRRAVRHYKIGADGAKRIDPVALSPRDFVDEWITRDWKEMAFWSESADRASMREWHAKMQRLPTEVIHPTMHCQTTLDLWQVRARF